RSTTGAGHPSCSDDHDVPTSRRPREARDHADLGYFLRLFHRISRDAQHFLDLLDIDDPRALFALRLPACAPAAAGRKVALEGAEAGLARIAIRNEGKGLVGE